MSAKQQQPKRRIVPQMVSAAPAAPAEAPQGPAPMPADVPSDYVRPVGRRFVIDLKTTRYVDWYKLVKKDIAERQPQEPTAQKPPPVPHDSTAKPLPAMPGGIPLLGSPSKKAAGRNRLDAVITKWATMEAAAPGSDQEDSGTPSANGSNQGGSGDEGGESEGGGGGEQYEQYEEDFIDDSEMIEYFEARAHKRTKHAGFFVNKGATVQVVEREPPPDSAPRPPRPKRPREGPKGDAPADAKKPRPAGSGAAPGPSAATAARGAGNGALPGALPSAAPVKPKPKRITPVPSAPLAPTPASTPTSTATQDPSATVPPPVTAAPATSTAAAQPAKPPAPNKLPVPPSQPAPATTDPAARAPSPGLPAPPAAQPPPAPVPPSALPASASTAAQPPPAAAPQPSTFAPVKPPPTSQATGRTAPAAARPRRKVPAKAVPPLPADAFPPPAGCAWSQELRRRLVDVREVAAKLPSPPPKVLPQSARRALRRVALQCVAHGFKDAPDRRNHVAAALQPLLPTYFDGPEALAKLLQKDMEAALEGAEQKGEALRKAVAAALSDSGSDDFQAAPFQWTEPLEALALAALEAKREVLCEKALDSPAMQLATQQATTQFWPSGGVQPQELLAAALRHKARAAAALAASRKEASSAAPKPAPPQPSAAPPPAPAAAPKPAPPQARAAAAKKDPIKPPIAAPPPAPASQPPAAPPATAPASSTAPAAAAGTSSGPAAASAGPTAAPALAAPAASAPTQAPKAASNSPPPPSGTPSPPPDTPGGSSAGGQGANGGGSKDLSEAEVAAWMDRLAPKVVAEEADPELLDEHAAIAMRRGGGLLRVFIALMKAGPAGATSEGICQLQRELGGAAIGRGHISNIVNRINHDLFKHIGHNKYVLRCFRFLPEVVRHPRAPRGDSGEGDC